MSRISLVIGFFALWFSCLVTPNNSTSLNSLKPTREFGDRKALLQPRVLESKNGVLEVVLSVEPAKFENSFLSFFTRSYNGSFPAPTLKVKRGDRVTITLLNKLEHTFEDPKHSNNTNLHFHGLHISPNGNSDNIHVVVKPSDSFTYELNIPSDHASGTYWYHNHFHGAVNSQLLGLMAGALIVEDEVKEIPEDLKNITEHIMLLQGLCLHHCEFEWDHLVAGIENLPVEEEGEGEEEKEKHDRRLHNHDENRRPTFNVQLQHTGQEPSAKSTSNHVIVNGQYRPSLNVKANEWTRLRIIQAMANAISEITIPNCETYVIARDGVYKSNLQKLDVVVIPSGSRADLLVKCPKGNFEMKNVMDKKRDVMLGDKMRIHTQTILTIISTGDQPSQPLPQNLPPRPAYLPNLLDLPVKGRYDIQFTMFAETAGEEAVLGVNFKNFNKKYINHTMKLNEMEEWTLRSFPENNCESEQHLLGSLCPPDHQGLYPHPFHIHTNHFQIATVDESRDPNKQLYELGEWRDTIPIFNQEVLVRMQPHQFTGKVMTHCHFAEHGDDGMSQEILIVN